MFISFGCLVDCAMMIEKSYLISLMRTLGCIFGDCITATNKANKGDLQLLSYKRDAFCDCLLRQAYSEKLSTLKGKNLLPWGANSFL